MRVVPLTPNQPTVVREALVRRGFDPVRADAAAHGLEPIAFLFDAVAGDEREVLASAARDQGLECLTGEGWALVSGGAARMAGLTRPGRYGVPDDIAEPVGAFLRGVVEVPDAVETARGSIPLDPPAVVGILNVTPDSFSDGGRYLDRDDALRRAESMIEAGATMLDVGAESTAPGRPSVAADEEWARLEPVLAGLVGRFPSMPVSVDTVKPETARRALDGGAWAINDVSGLRLAPEIASLCADRGAGLVLMHSRGGLGELASYDHAEYSDVAVAVMDELMASVEVAQRHGVPGRSIVLDPGLGFAKMPDHNDAVVSRLRGLTALGFPVMVGPSRKRFLARVAGDDMSRRDSATVAVCVAAYFLGASLFRVHEVAAVVDALKVVRAIRGA